MEKIKKALEFASRNRLEHGQNGAGAAQSGETPVLPEELASNSLAAESEDHASSAPPVPDAEPVSAQPVPAGEPAIPSSFEFTRTRVERVPYSTLAANKVILPQDDESDASRAYQILGSQIVARVRDTGFNTIAVVSPGPEEGKSLTAINLAVSLTRRLERTALVVDLDFRRPATARYLGLTPERGVEHVLRGECEIADALVSPGIARFTALPIAAPSTAASALIDTGACRALAHELKHRYANRIVLFDLPPLLAYGDALSFLPQVDAALLVVTEGVTKRDAIEHSLKILDGTALLGTVLNQSAEKQAGYS